jgi:hypothetical protein
MPAMAKSIFGGVCLGGHVKDAFPLDSDLGGHREELWDQFALSRSKMSRLKICDH